MSRNRIQFQIGLSLPEFCKSYGTEEQCRQAVAKGRWPNGYHCDHCGGDEVCRFERGNSLIYQCKHCGHQTSLTSGTLFEHHHIPLTSWFIAFHLMSQSKNCISTLELHRHLDVNIKSATLLKHKIMQVMFDSDQETKLSGRIEVDDAYLGGVLKGGGAGRGSTNKVPFIAAIQTDEDMHPLFARFSPVEGFSKDAVKEWAEQNLEKAVHTVSDGLACFNALDDFGFHEIHIVSKEGHESSDTHFHWVNTVLSNVKTALSGTFHCLNFAKYGYRYLADLQYRFNRRFDLKELFKSLVDDASRHRPCSKAQLLV